MRFSASFTGNKYKVQITARRAGYLYLYMLVKDKTEYWQPIVTNQARRFLPSGMLPDKPNYLAANQVVTLDPVKDFELADGAPYAPWLLIFADEQQTSPEFFSDAQIKTITKDNPKFVGLRQAGKACRSPCPLVVMEVVAKPAK